MLHFMPLNISLFFIAASVRLISFWLCYFHFSEYHNIIGNTDGCRAFFMYLIHLLQEHNLALHQPKWYPHEVVSAKWAVVC